MRVVVAIACALALVARHGAADPIKDARAKAASHFKQGQIYFKGGDWDRAIVEYQAAFELSKEPLLVFNIALCQDRAQRPELALDGFQRYLELAPLGEGADEAREHVARLTPIVDALRAERAAVERAAEDKRAEEQRRAEEHARADERLRAEAARVEHERRVARAAPLFRRAKLERYGAIAAAGTAIVATGLAIGLGARAIADGNAITNHTSGAWSDALLARQTDGPHAQGAAFAFAVTGGALAIGGAVLYWRGRRDERAARILVGVSPSGAVAVAARF